METISHYILAVSTVTFVIHLALNASFQHRGAESIQSVSCTRRYPTVIHISSYSCHPLNKVATSGSISFGIWMRHSSERIVAKLKSIVHYRYNAVIFLPNSHKRYPHSSLMPFVVTHRQLYEITWLSTWKINCQGHFKCYTDETTPINTVLKQQTHSSQTNVCILALTICAKSYSLIVEYALVHSRTEKRTY